MIADNSARYALAVRIGEHAAGMATHGYKLVRSMGTARSQLNGDFGALVADLPFSENVARHLVVLSADKKFATKKPSPEAVAAILDALKAIGAPSVPPAQVAPEPAVTDVAAPPPPAAEVATAQPADGGIRFSPARLYALTGLSAAECRAAAALSDEDFTEAMTVGPSVWLAERDRRQRLAAQARDRQVRISNLSPVQLSLPPEFDEAAE